MKKITLKLILIFVSGFAFAQNEDNTVTLTVKAIEKSKISIVENEKGRFICDSKTKRPLDGLFKIPYYSSDYIFFKNGKELIRYHTKDVCGEIEYHLNNDSSILINSMNQPEFKFDNTLSSRIIVGNKTVKTIIANAFIDYGNWNLDSLIQIIKQYDNSVLINAFNIQFTNAIIKVKRAVQYDGQIQYCFDVENKFRYELYYYPEGKSGSILKYDSDGLLLELEDYFAGLILNKEIFISESETKHQYFENGKFKNEWID